MNRPIYNNDLVILAAARITRSVAAGMINVAFPYFVLTEFHYGALVIGLIYVAATMATAVVSFFVGISADIWGKRGTLITASLFLPISALMVYLSHGLWLIVPAAMLGGYSATGSLAGGGIGGVVQPIQSAVLAGLVKGHERTRYFALFTFGAGVTAAFGALLTKVFNVRDIFLAAAIISAFGIPLLWKVRVDNVKGKITRLKTGKIIGKFTLTGMLNGFAQGLVIPFLIPFFVLFYHIPKSEMAEFAFASGLLGAFALLAAPALERNFGFLNSVLLTRGVGLVLFVLFPIIHFLPLAVAIYILAPSLRVAALPIQQSELTRRVDEDEMGRALGINQVARLAASSAASGISGHMLENSLFELPFFLYGLVMAANLLLYVKFFGVKANRKSGAKPQSDEK